MGALGGSDLLETVGESGFPDLKELRAVLKEVDTAPVERALTGPAGGAGRKPYPRGPIIRAYLSLPFLSITDISALRRELMNNPAFRAACGFTTSVPSRPTFSRVFGQLDKMPEWMDRRHEQAVRKLREYRSDLGKEVAVDSTMVKTNSNPRRKPISDVQASWGKQHDVRESKGWRWVYGYKAHTATCANYDTPLAVIVTTGSESDMNYLVPLVEKLQRRPEAVIADRGYDSVNNNEWLYRRGIAPVIHKKRPPKGYHTR
ncbi:MAG: transposase, partial [Dehalococcoidia bacterium]|nr:transposase [Dehalococcoidia bacterium]